MSLASAAMALAASSSPGKAGHRAPKTRPGTRTFKARIFPINQPLNRGPYPEQTLPQYSAADGKWGLSFSGGGSRAYSAMLGQMRALVNAGLLGDVGAISVVSGASWFGTPFTFAPQYFSDATLLGPLVAPSDITVGGLTAIDPDCLGARITNLTDANLLALLAAELVQILEFNYIPIDKLYSRLLNDLFLVPYGLNNTGTLFTLNEDSLHAIRARNPSLKAAPFFLPRAHRPFLIVNATQIYQPTQAQQVPATSPTQVYRSMEYTPLYSGAPQLVDQGPPTGLPYGGGYVESFAFDTPTPISREGNIALLPQGPYPFLLSDMMGSSSASVANVVEQRLPQQFASDDPFPSFDYWPISNIGKVGAMEYDFGDGGTLDDTGIVSLLRRGYRTIFAFVNSSVPINSTNPICVDGIDGQISRLFGYIPSQANGNMQSTQVFSSDQYQSVVQGLKATRAAGGVPVYVDRFPVIPANAFGLAPYTPKIFWIYNDLNQSWFNQLNASVQALFADPSNTLQDFPNYATFEQNHDEPILLTATQVNLLAHMWAYGISTAFARKGYAFGVPIN